MTEEQPADYDSKQYEAIIASWQQDSTAYLNRYYDLYYKQSNDTLATSVYVRQSPNKICVLGITQPPAFDSIHLRVELIGEKVKTDTVLCELSKEGQIVGQVRAEMEGKLLELNQRYNTEDPQSLMRDHMDIGFIAIIMPKTEDSAVQLKEFEKKTSIQK
ncbi:uncharacterized protein B0P05DRAFT_551874 [Gilbertella persicaria]|uniref:uncharacterized protein n=1 Tax=Gilbertella persicaria TaxID=101096 RepID=UPI00221FFD4E|nr:uncharacterized protein B0P05DRAFT_551874 [Gilbertella persicaria]KAI8068127.1 hypothetical protein B0P05DRAFT_551874 [Gilbertella persicaria]